MTSRERVARAMRHEPVDRVPVFCQLALGHYFLHAGLPPHRIWFTSEGFAEALVTLQRRYRFDGILVNLPGRPPDLLASLRRVEKTADGETLFWKNGHVTFVPRDDNPRHQIAEGTAPPRADFAALDPDHLGDLDRFTSYWWNTYHVPNLALKESSGLLEAVPDYFLRTLQLVREATGGQVSVHGEVFSPFTHFMELLGYEPALLALLDDAPKATALLKRLTASAIVWAEAQARAGADAVLISSAFAGGGFLSRAMYAEFVLPHERRLAAAVRACGVPVYTHTCGRIGDRLDLMEATGIQGLDTLDPPPLGNTDLAEAKRAVGARLFLKGNMNPVKLLAAVSAEEVAAEAHRCLNAGASGGGYLLSTACSVSPRVEPWKLELLVPLAEEFGRHAD
jgi:uroporphyrinogen-III decarboxylase